MTDIDKLDSEDQPRLPEHSPETERPDTLPTPQHSNTGLGESITHALKVAWAENRQFFLLLTCIVFFKSAVADLSSISGASMEPTLLDGDKVWVNKLAYDIKVPFIEINLAEVGEPKRGDIVIIDSKRAGKRLIKRIIGLPHDTVAMQNNALVINGEPVNYEVVSRDESSVIIIEALLEFSHRAQLTSGYVSRSRRSYGPAVVPEDQYFVLGDNRDNSADSRAYSFVPREEIVGRSRSVVFSLDGNNLHFFRSERFLTPLN
jgi:signal peptidase I